MSPLKAHKDWATLLRNRLGGKASVVMYNDDDNVTQVPIFSSENSDGLVAATIGLMDLNQSKKPNLVLRTELMMYSRNNDKLVSNVLSTIAFYILKNGWRANPGTVFESMVSMYFPETHLPHIFFTAPFQWEEWGNVNLDDRVIHPLLAIPVSDAEAELATNRTGGVLESLWSDCGTDVFDWSRKSAA